MQNLFKSTHLNCELEVIGNLRKFSVTVRSETDCSKLKEE